MPCPISICEEKIVTVSSGEICRYPENGLDAPGASSANAEKPTTRLEPAAATPMRNDRRDGTLSCAKSVAARSLMLRPQQLGGSMDGRADALVSVAAADVSAHRVVNVLVELSLKVGDGGNRKGGISWGYLTPPLLH